MLAVLKLLPFSDSELRQGRFHVNALRPFSRGLNGLKIGYIGMGRIATAVAERLQAFRTNGIYFGPNVTTAPGVQKRTFDELLREADLVTLHLRERPQQVLTVLQDDIVLGRLAPGARLVEEELTDRLKTKRHMLRQAFVELERFGLIERKRNCGASVLQLTLEDVGQIYAVREILERAAAAEIPLPMTKANLARIAAAQRAHDAAVAAFDAKAMFRANFEFHVSLFASCANPYLAAAIEDFRRKTHVVWSYAIVKPGYFCNLNASTRQCSKPSAEATATNWSICAPTTSTSRAMRTSRRTACASSDYNTSSHAPRARVPARSKRDPARRINSPTMACGKPLLKSVHLPPELVVR